MPSILVLPRRVYSHHYHRVYSHHYHRVYSHHYHRVYSHHTNFYTGPRILYSPSLISNAIKIASSNNCNRSTKITLFSVLMWECFILYKINYFIELNLIYFNNSNNINVCTHYYTCTPTVKAVFVSEMTYLNASPLHPASAKGVWLPPTSSTVSLIIWCAN